MALNPGPNSMSEASMLAKLRIASVRSIGPSSRFSQSGR
jgi:hypothetical protein